MIYNCSDRLSDATRKVSGKTEDRPQYSLHKRHIRKESTATAVMKSMFRDCDTTCTSDYSLSGILSYEFPDRHEWTFFVWMIYDLS